MTSIEDEFTWEDGLVSPEEQARFDHLSLIAAQRKRRPTPQHKERNHFRRKLIELCRNDRRYQNIIACEIRPAWKRLMRVCDVQAIADAAEAAHFEIHPPLRLGPDNYDWGEIEPLPAPLHLVYLEPASDQHPDLRRYIDTVYSRGVAPLGLLSAGKPVPWAAGFIHASAASDPHPLNPVYFDHPYEYLCDPPFDPDDLPSTEAEIRAKLQIIVSPERAIVTLYWNEDELPFGSNYMHG